MIWPQRYGAAADFANLTPQPVGGERRPRLCARTNVVVGCSSKHGAPDLYPTVIPVDLYDHYPLNGLISQQESTKISTLSAA